MFSLRLWMIGLLFTLFGFLLPSCQHSPGKEKITERKVEPSKSDSGSDKATPQCKLPRDCSDCAETCENNRCVLLSCTQDQECRCGYVCLSGGCFVPDLEVVPDQ